MDLDRATIDFLEKLNQDDEMQRELDSSLEGSGSALQAMVEFARTKGFAVSAESLNAVKKALQDPGQLLDSQLEGVAGGFNPQPEPPASTSAGDLLNPNNPLRNYFLRW